MTSLFYSLLILALFSRSAFSDTEKLEYKENGVTVVLLTMEATFVITKDGTSSNLYIPDHATPKGSIEHVKQNESDYEIINFAVVWNNSMSNQFTMVFKKTTKDWQWINATFLTTLENESITVPMYGMIGEFGNESPIVSDTNTSFLCNSPLDFSTATFDKVKVSVTWSHFRVEVYPKMNGTFDTVLRPCTVDFDDKIVPIAVGGALGLLLLLVVIIYVISYIRDRRQQSKELRSGYNRIEHPEPNHHS